MCRTIRLKPKPSKKSLERGKVDSSSSKRLSVVLSLLYLWSAPVPTYAGEHDEVSLISMHASIIGGKLRYALRNEGDLPLMVYRDFCYDLHMSATVMSGIKLNTVAGHFSSGIVRDSLSFVRLEKKGSETICYLDYYPLDTETVNSADVVWKTNLFVGNPDGTYKFLHRFGMFPVIERLDNVVPSLAAPVDETVEAAFEVWRRRASRQRN